MKNKLPKQNKYGFYEFRLESIGGLGANVTGKILGEAGILYQGFNGSNFASYGSEKKGTPVKAFVRFCEPEIPVRINSPVEEPDTLVIFHENLLKADSVLHGVYADTTIIVNTRKTPTEVRELLKLNAGRVVCVDALKIAMEEKSRTNMVLLGTICKTSGFLDPEAIIMAIKDAFGFKYAQTIPSNIKAFERGQVEFQEETFTPDSRFKVLKHALYVPKLGYKNAPKGGIIFDTGSTRNRDLAASRQGFIPILNKESCIHCAECDSTCPDCCFVFEKRTIEKTGKQGMFLKGINYQYCKGCLKCVEICKPKALTTVKENDYRLDEITVRG